MSRQSWIETWLWTAQVMSTRSLCTRDHVGAVIVDAHQRVVATGYNGPPSGFAHNQRPCREWCVRAQKRDRIGESRHLLNAQYDDCPSLHAEANALLVCDRTVREGGSIFVTSAICMSCAKLIANSGLSYVYVPPPRPGEEHRNSEVSYRFLESCGVTVLQLDELLGDAGATT